MDGGSPIRRLKTPEALAWSNLPPVWEDFLRFRNSADFLQAVVRLFEPQLLRCLGPTRLQRLLTGSVAPRRMGGPSHLFTDCQFVLTTPSAERPPISHCMWVRPMRSMQASSTCVHPWIRRPVVSSRCIDRIWLSAGKWRHPSTRRCTPFPIGATVSCCS